MTRRRKGEKPQVEIIRRSSHQTDPEDGNVRLPFRRLDEPAVSWKSDVASLEKCLLSPKEKRRRKDDLAKILSSPEYKRLTIQQLRVELNRIKRWEKELDRFMYPQKLFLIERVLAQLELTAHMTSPDVWPELFAVIEEYQALKIRTAPARFSVVRSMLEQSEG
ncbi:hypothetical protein HZC53_04340 [Candidatus Uhrbacteria bacterium]|nr:hypothetical protein [Candidatus Uhrbacteria bacterium]